MRDATFTTLHVIQFIFAVTVIGLYGTDLNHKPDVLHVDGKWIYAIVVAVLSSLTSILCLAPFFLRFAFVPVWEFILFVLWIAQFGLFASLYIHADAKGNRDFQRMKNAIWVDLLNALLWLLGSALTGAYWWFHRERATRYTGRGKL
ncbi:hypothetical protein GGR50DRAFT_695829 [Xylaria sp. CBS 124048]|nr:hypothetical protein GGR50DRAFT_695829 [Xylaria sp. CBS 124048]